VEEKRKKVIVDADACPRSIKEIISMLTSEYSWEMITVASIDHNIIGEHKHIIVDNESQAADMMVMKIASKGNIVVTQDWGLAAIVMGKGVRVISPRGIIYDEKSIDFLLEERDMKAKLRRKGGRTKGPSAWSKEDDERFENNMKKLMCHKKEIVEED